MTDITPFDAGHPMIGITPSWLTTDIQTTPQGQVLILTLRVPNATLTVALDKPSAEGWIRQVKADIDKMSSLIVAPPGFQPPPMNGQVPKT